MTYQNSYWALVLDTEGMSDIEDSVSDWKFIVTEDLTLVTPVLMAWRLWRRWW